MKRFAAFALLLVSSVSVSAPASALSPSIGYFDGIAAIDLPNQTVYIWGWALTSDYPTVPLGVRITVDGAVYPMPAPGYITADQYRPDVGVAYPGYGDYHGFGAWVKVPPGTHTLCAQAQNSGVYSWLTNCHTYTLEVDIMYPSTTIPEQCSDSGMWDGGWNACLTDNAGLYFCFDSTYQPATAAMKTAVRNTMSYSYTTTDLNTYEEGCVYTGTGETDIVYQELATLPGSAVGFTWCDDATSSLRCDQHYITLKQASLAGYLPDKAWGLACHETGHAVGFLHGGNSDPVVDGNSNIIGCMGNWPVNKWVGENNAMFINRTY
jgi:hypothetical protein